MTNILSAFTGGSTPNITNPFTPFPLVTPSAAEASLSGVGALTPDQQAFVDFFGGEQDERTRDAYAKLGLGGSTMEAQDLGANELARLAQAAGLESGNIGQAIQEQQVSGGAQQAEQALGVQAGLGTQRNQLAASGQAFSQGQSSLTNLVNAFSRLGSAGGSAAAAAPA